MKKITSILMLLLMVIGLGLVVDCQPAQAQTTTTWTTLSSALNATSTSVRVASATNITGFTNGQPTTWLYIDREFMPVYSVNGTTLTVQRNGGGSGSAHASSAKVWVGPYNAFLQGDPAGTCTSTNIAYLPAISVPTGNIWNCGNSLWTALVPYAGRQTVGAVLTPAATLTITNPVHHVTTSAVTVTTITANWLPGTGGCINLIPDAAMTGMTTSTGGNIALATSSVANKVLTMCYDPAAAKWYPSY